MIRVSLLVSSQRGGRGCVDLELSLAVNAVSQMLRPHVTHEDHELADNDIYKPTSQLTKPNNIYVLHFKYSKQLVFQIDSLNWNVIYLLETTQRSLRAPPPPNTIVFEHPR